MISRLVFLSLLLAPALGAQGICFSGPIRPGCQGFVLFEASAIGSTGGSDHGRTFRPQRLTTGYQGPAITLFDLPSYPSFALGYIAVRDRLTAAGVVGELGLGQSGVGDMPRGTITGRWRRQLPNVTLDVGAGPLFAQVVAPPTSGCCPDRTAGYGATIETALMFRGYAGVTAGADLLHGAGRTSGALHLGARVGSYGTVVLAGTVTALTLLLVAAWHDPS